MGTDGELAGLGQNPNFATSMGLYVNHRADWESARYGYGLLKWLKIKSGLTNIMGRELDDTLNADDCYDRVVPDMPQSFRFYQILVSICETVTTG